MNSDEQRQINELRHDVRQLAGSFSDFVGEARERGAEIVGLINTRVAERQGDHDTLRAEVQSIKAGSDENHAVAMRRIDALKASGRWWFGTAITTALAALVAILGGWAENVFGK